MKIGTNFGFFIKRNSLEKVIEKIAAAGFQAIDFSFSRDYGIEEKDEKEYYKKIKALCGSLNLEVTQGHSYFERADLSAEYFLGDEYFNLQCRAIKRAAYMGAPWLTVHPFTTAVQAGGESVYGEDKFEKELNINLVFFERLRPVFKEYNVGCAIENLAEYNFNLKSPCRCFGSVSDDLLVLLKALDSELFGVCFDIGHLNLLPDESISHFVLSLKDKIKILHAHDNFGVLNGWGGGLDRHLPPFFGNVPWKEVMDSLRKTGFDNALSFECINYSPNEEFDFFNAEYVRKAGEYILKM